MIKHRLIGLVYLGGLISFSTINAHSQPQKHEAKHVAPERVELESVIRTYVSSNFGEKIPVRNISIYNINVQGSWALAGVKPKGNYDSALVILKKQNNHWIGLTLGTDLSGSGAEYRIPKNIWRKWNLGDYSGGGSNETKNSSNNEPGDAAKYGLTPSQVVAYGLEKYLDVEHTMGHGDGSDGYPGTSDQDALCDYYFQCSKNHNELTIKHFSSSDQSRIKLFRNAWADSDNERIALQEKQDGPGSIFGHAESERYAYREDFIAKLLSVWPKGSTAKINAEDNSSAIEAMKKQLPNTQKSTRLQEVILSFPSRLTIDASSTWVCKSPI